MQNIILHTENLSIGYTGKKQHIIRCDISIALEKGKLVSIIGKNGIGKSTFLKTVTNIIPALSGNIKLNGKNLTEYHSSELAQTLSLVLTEKLPPSNLSVYEIVALGRQPYTNWLGTLSEEDTSKIEEAIRLTEISDFIHKKHYEISDGQLQRTMIARALAQDTPLIILDEPTTHLDLVHKVSLLKLLQKLCKETHKTILYSTHDLDLAIQMADEMLVFTEEKVFSGEPKALISANIFDKIFTDSTIYFDKEKGSFSIK